MQEMAEFLDKNNLSNRLSSFDPHKQYDETDVFIDIIPKNELEYISQHHNYILPYSNSAHFSKHKTSRGELKIYVLPLADKQIKLEAAHQSPPSWPRNWHLICLFLIFFMPFAIYAVYRLIRHHLRSIDELSDFCTTGLS
jgi:two-component system OmpR family sensor kinase/two-component system sensor histidine kinase QseC